MDEITATQLDEARRRGEALTLIDVREPHEWETGRIEGATLIPLGELPGRLAQLSRDDTIVCYCKMGGRSAHACRLLREAGFANLRNLVGGILAWHRDVDPQTGTS